MTRRLARPVGITATGQHYPERVYTNDDLAQFMDTNDEWIRTRTGISQRRWVEPGQGASDLAAPALRMALDRRGMKADELDAIIIATVTPDTFFPSTACRVQEKLGATKAYGFDLSAACSGFLYALTTGAALVASGTHQKVAVVGVDIMSSIINKEDRTTAVLFGDGAGAVILEAVPEGGILDFEHFIDGSGGCHLFMPAGEARDPRVPKPSPPRSISSSSTGRMCSRRPCAKWRRSAASCWIGIKSRRMTSSSLCPTRRTCASWTPRPSAWNWPKAA